MKKAIIFLINDFPEGEADNAANKLYAKALIDLGYKTEMYVAYSSKFNINRLNKKSNGVWQDIKYKYLSGTTRYSSNIFYKLYLVLAANFNSFFALTKLNRKDRIFFYNPRLHGFAFTVLLARLIGLKPIVIQTEQYSLLINKLTVHLEERIIARFAKQIWAITPAIFNYFQHDLKAKASLHFIPSIVVDLDRFNKPTSNQKYRIGYLGTFAEKDDVSFIIKAFAQAKEEMPALQLHLIGHPAKGFPSDVERANCSTTGAIPYNQIPIELAKCDLLIANRKDNAFARTGFPIKLAEYLASGIPVALVDFEEYHPYVKKNEALYYQAGNLNELVEVIIKRYKDYNYYSKVGLDGIEIAKKYFSKEVLKDTFQQLLD